MVPPVPWGASKNKYVVCQKSETFVDRAGADQQARYLDTKVTGLNSEENKARFYEKNQYRLHWTLSSTWPKSRQDECSVGPRISLHGERLDP